MDWEFSIGWFLLGLLIFIAGGALVLYHQPFADHLAGGVSSYDKVKFWGIIIALVGFLVMANLHTALLTAFVKMVFGR